MNDFLNMREIVTQMIYFSHMALQGISYLL